ncbi:hypothetical protein CTAYLR_002812 [Chrysophaeum taylorii]|uniref:COMM domain-containing protein n=1 Tax=Chrysophaeum taylorii TaxID=2483200 RepID=A0AAD7U7Z5_9STRA|nr:hypothetical protein CTAYLR_002812 [Chrysophaeum taylorii]
MVAAGRIGGLRCFGGESVPLELKEDLVPLNAFAPKDLDALVTLVLEHLRAMDARALISAVSAFAKSRNIKNMGVLEAGVRGLVALLQACAKHARSSADLGADAGVLGLDDDRAAAVAGAWDSYEKPPDDLADLDGETLRQLVDLEWKFGVTCASSESAEPVGKTFLQLKLVLDRHDSGTYENVYLELTLPQFYDFLAHMEKAKAALTQISSKGAASS